MERIYTVKLRNGASYQARGDEALGLEVHQECVIRKEFFFDFGVITRVGVQLDPGKGGEMPQIQRRPTEADRDAVVENESRARNAMKTAHQMVEHLGLPMKLLNACYSLDIKLLTIQFTAEGRVDFRELVKELSRSLNIRIELRQIGVRDESAIHGGISVCGQVLCCCRFLNEFNSINVRMAKDQDLSLTPATISGVCGRLKCCLKYEHEGYLELEKAMPRRGDFCDSPSGKGRVIDRNLLTQEVTLSLESGSLARFPRTDVKILPPDKSRLMPRKGGPERRERDSGNANGGNGGNGGNGRPPRDRQSRHDQSGSAAPVSAAEAPGAPADQDAAE